MNGLFAFAAEEFFKDGLEVHIFHCAVTVNEIVAHIVLILSDAICAGCAEI